MIPNDGNGLLKCYGHMSSCAVERITISGDELNDALLVSVGADDYDAIFLRYAERELDGVPLNDMSLLNAM